MVEGVRDPVVLSANNLQIPTTITALAIDPLVVWVQSTDQNRDHVLVSLSPKLIPPN